MLGQIHMAYPAYGTFPRPGLRKLLPVFLIPPEKKAKGQLRVRLSFPDFQSRNSRAPHRLALGAIRDGLGPVGTGLRVYGGLHSLSPPAGGRAKCQSGKEATLATGGKSLTEAKGRWNVRGSREKLPFIDTFFSFLLFFFLASKFTHGDRATRRRPASLRLRPGRAGGTRISPIPPSCPQVA